MMIAYQKINKSKGVHCNVHLVFFIIICLNVHLLKKDKIYKKIVQKGHKIYRGLSK